MKNFNKLLIFGLGNPGHKFKNTRHNIGFKVLDEISKRLNLNFKSSKKFESDYCTKEFIINEEKVKLEIEKKHNQRKYNQQKSIENNPSTFKHGKLISDEIDVNAEFYKKIRYPYVQLHLIKPQTFMNLSGTSIRKYLESLNVKKNKKNEFKPTRILVIYDDIDLNCGEFKIVNKAKSSHNGISDIKRKIGTEKFNVLKVGIGNDRYSKKGDISNFVLSNFNEDNDIINSTISKIYSLLNDIIHLDGKKSIEKVNKN